MKPNAGVHPADHSPIDHVMSLLQDGAGNDYIGEPVSQLDHALQAAQLAVNAGASESMILAALLHDVGHNCDPNAEPMPGLGIARHEQVGADYLSSLGFRSEISTLVASHVSAKRYLATTTPGYLGKLSDASLQTLEWQGGAMTDEECRAFEASPIFKNSLQLRAWDEAAKDPIATPRRLEDYRRMLMRNLTEPLGVAQLDGFQKTGFLHLKGWYTPDEMQAVVLSTEDLQGRRETPGRWMQYFEENATGDRQLCRIENFLDYEPRFDAIARGRGTLNLLSQLMSESAVLFKEKINFKLPGGQGFAPHQDAPAFTSFGQKFHITMMLSLDKSNSENGCLEVAVPERRTGEMLAMKDDLTLADEVVASLHWQPIHTRPGDLVLFDSYLPHRSGPNRSGKSRRALYATYNRKADGDVRERYFERKRRVFPPDIERKSGVSYDGDVFNVGNPVSRRRVS